MCFDISSTKIKQLIEKNRTAKFYRDFEYEPFFHTNGFIYPTVSIIKMNDPKIIYPSVWGFIPEWGQADTKSFRKKYNTLNAKSETLLNSKMFQESAREQRCIIIADGFFEPHNRYDETIPYYCYIPSNKLEDGRDFFVFAGIYSETDNINSNCSIITTEANNFFSEIHNVKKRMPLVLNEELVGEWLDPNLSKNHISSILKEGFTKKEFNSHSISKSIYNRKKNTNNPNILDKVNYNTLFD